MLGSSSYRQGPVQGDEFNFAIRYFLFSGREVEILSD